MKIYLSHSRSFNYEQELYEPIKASEVAKHHNIIFPHDQSDVPYPTRQKLQEKEIDLIIAEVSYPSTGQGIELGWASTMDIPIVCLYKLGIIPSNSLYTVTSKFLMYTDVQNMIEDIEGALRMYERS